MPDRSTASPLTGKAPVPEPLRIGSLFSGIGGLELGLEAALAEAGIPHRVVWQVEIDPFCRSVLAARWPDVDRSVTDVRAAASLPRVDIICGGFPCQDVSGAGLGAGLDGERSGLWFVFRDIVEALAPSLVIVENVASGKRRYLCRVRRDLHALGYRTRALQLGAHDVGAPHRRERVFVVAHAHDGRQPQERQGANGLDQQRQAVGGRAVKPDGAGADGGGCCGDRPARGEAGGTSPACDAGGTRLALAHGHGHGHGREGERRGRLLDGERTPRGDDADGRGGADGWHLAHAISDGRDLGPWTRDVGAGGAQPADGGGMGDPCGTRREGAEHEGGAALGGLPTWTGRQRGQAERGVGGGADGLPARMDRRLPERWPAGRGEAQASWEPPRAVTEREPGRRARLHALGNAVVPAQAREVGRAVIAMGLLGAS